MIDKLIKPVSELLDKFIPDADTKQKIAHEIATMSEKHIHEIAKAQIEVNKEEAKGNWFQSSWRPATAWICVCGFAVNFLINIHMNTKKQKPKKQTVNSFSKLKALIKLRDNDRQTNKTSKRTS